MAELRCEHCCGVFYQKRTDRLRFCSRDCAFAFRKDAATARKALTPTTPLPTCNGCGVALPNLNQRRCEPCRKRCEAERARANYMPVANTKLLACHECGSESVVHATRKRFCSAACETRNRKRRERLRHKLTQRVSVVRCVDPIRVFERDGWTCQLCRQPAPRSKLGSMDLDAPVLDHVIPRSADGAHTYANTQCLCRACNALKGDKLAA